MLYKYLSNRNICLYTNDDCSKRIDKKTRLFSKIFMVKAIYLILINLFILNYYNNQTKEVSFNITNSLRFLAVADLDKNSSRFDKSNNPYYISYLILGKIEYNTNNIRYNNLRKYCEIPITQFYGYEKRGLELSELIYWNSKYLTFDDATGIVYSIIPKYHNILVTFPDLFAIIESNNSDFSCDNISIELIPTYILSENGYSGKGMKIEWASIFKDKLYVGSFGKEFCLPDGSAVTSENNFYISIIENNGRISYRNWKEIFNKLREHTNSTYPGYMMHEAVNFRNETKEWCFLPRRYSLAKYDEKKDEKRGTNILIKYSEKGEISLTRIKQLSNRTHKGFSSFKFVPKTNEKEIVALRTIEDSYLNQQLTYMVVFDINGNLITPEIQLSESFKYEGIEFVIS